MKNLIRMPEFGSYDGGLQNFLKREMMEEEAVLVVAKWDYDSKQDEELSIKSKEKLKLIDDSRSWWKVQKQNGQCGYVPSNYVKRDKPGIVERLRKGISAKRGGKPVTRPISPRNSENSHPHPTNPGGEMQCSQLARVMYHYKAAQDDELNLNKGEQVNVLEKSGDGWWRGECNGQNGWFPSNYVSEEDTGMSNSHGSSTSSKGDDSIPDDFVLGVTTLYAFKGRTDEELNFEASEPLDIISNPSDDQDWWKARNKHGQVGLVPSNYVKVVENADPVCPTKFFIEDAVPKPIDLPRDDNSFAPPTAGFYDRDWFHGRITRTDSEKVLSCPGESGLFLIRESETMPGDFAVSVKAPERVKHFKVTRSDKKFCIGQRKFESLDDLVDHYKRSPIFSSDDGELKLYLTRPNQRN